MRRGELISACVAMTGLVGSSIAIYRESSAATEPEPEARAIARLTLVTEAVKRRSRSGLVWRSAEQGEALYPGDGVFVAEDSSATLEFDDGSFLHVEEGSLVIVEARADEATGARSGAVRLKSGGVTGESHGRFTVEVASTEARMTPGTAITARASGKDGELTVAGGKAEVSSAGSAAPVWIESGQRAELDARGVRSSSRFPVTLVSPGSAEVVTVRAQETTRFSWRGGVAPYSLEVARDRAFLERVLRAETREPSYEAPGLAVAEGNLYWKILDATGAVVSETRAVKIVLERAPALLQPSPAQVILAPSGSMLTFAWSRSPAARGYQLLVGTDAALSRPVLEQRTIDTRLALVSELAPGTYHWRVHAEFARAGRVSVSETGTFRLIDKPQPLAPELYESEVEFVDDETATTFERHRPPPAKKRKGRRR